MYIYLRDNPNMFKDGLARKSKRPLLEKLTIDRQNFVLDSRFMTIVVPNCIRSYMNKLTLDFDQ